jgi:hypothetical protein
MQQHKSSHLNADTVTEFFLISTITRKKYKISDVTPHFVTSVFNDCTGFVQTGIGHFVLSLPSR